MTDEVTQEEPVEGVDLQSEPRSNQELKQLAMDILDGKVFTDRHFREDANQMAQLVFMPLVFMDEQSMPLFLAKQPDLLFENPFLFVAESLTKERPTKRRVVMVVVMKCFLPQKGRDSQ